MVRWVVYGEEREQMSRAAFLYLARPGSVVALGIAA